MKAYTDIEQSKKLAEILPIETADMCYPKDAFEYNYDKEPVCHYSGIGLAHPCWSLTALLSVLPSATLDSSNDHYYRLHCMERFTEWHDNPIDACIEMVIKLNEQKLS